MKVHLMSHTLKAEMIFLYLSSLKMVEVRVHHMFTKIKLFKVFSFLVINCPFIGKLEGKVDFYYPEMFVINF